VTEESFSPEIFDVVNFSGDPEQEEPVTVTLINGTEVIRIANLGYELVGHSGDPETVGELLEQVVTEESFSPEVFDVVNFSGDPEQEEPVTIELINESEVVIRAINLSYELVGHSGDPETVGEISGAFAVEDTFTGESELYNMVYIRGDPEQNEPIKVELYSESELIRTVNLATETVQSPDPEIAEVVGEIVEAFATPEIASALDTVDVSGDPEILQDLVVEFIQEDEVKLTVSYDPAIIKQLYIVTVGETLKWLGSNFVTILEEDDYDEVQIDYDKYNENAPVTVLKNNELVASHTYSLVELRDPALAVVIVEWLDGTPAVDPITTSFDPSPILLGATFNASATFSDINLDDTHTAVWDWGDETNTSGTVTEVNGSGSVNDSHSYSSAGEFTITLTVIDNASFSGTSIRNVTVISANVAPVVGEINAPVDPIQVNTAINVDANFTDLNQDNTHTAVWDWGDGTSSPGAVTEENGNGSVTGSHIYNEAGVYTINLTVTDNSNLSDSEEFKYVVVYDPLGGFVTGGGWILSPTGAYAADETLTGKATFGFVSKYKKGANVPTGETQFQFTVANLNFHSDSYDWLVVSGEKAKYKGVGTINGAGNYGFMLTAIDGNIKGGTDKFRIKIWNKESGDTVVYDNKMGSSEASYDATEIEGGSIVIHKGK
jgi:hypothetical protein